MCFSHLPVLLSPYITTEKSKMTLSSIFHFPQWHNTYKTYIYITSYNDTSFKYIALGSHKENGLSYQDTYLFKVGQLEILFTNFSLPHPVIGFSIRLHKSIRQIKHVINMRIGWKQKQSTHLKHITAPVI